MARAGDAEGGERSPRGISRRAFLVGGGVGVGLVLAWTLWPRRYRHNLRANPGETIFNAFLKIGKDGRVIVVIPQAELGQGVATALPQILGDELGADWRSIGVEPAPLNQLYANTLLADELSQGALPEWLGEVRGWSAREIATRDALMLTGGSTSIRTFEPRLREAGAAARALLTKVAARRWNDDWQSLSAHGGFVWRGEEAIAFGDLAEAAADEAIPGELPMRSGTDHRLTGQPQPRLDAPGKVDGSALFAADVRIPDMVYAATLSAPPGGKLARADNAAGDAVPEALMLFQNPQWVGAIATNSWAAERAVAAMKPSWEVPTPQPDTRSIDAALVEALGGGQFEDVLSTGDVEAALAGQGTTARYAVGLAPSAPPETLTATARVSGDRLEIWAPTQAPGLARAAAAAEIGLPERQVTIYPMLAIGGGYGRKLEMDAIRQAAIMTYQMGRPVQLIWSRLQDIHHDRFRPAAMAQLDGRLAPSGMIAAGAHASRRRPPRRKWRTGSASAPDCSAAAARRWPARSTLRHPERGDRPCPRRDRHPHRPMAFGRTQLHDLLHRKLHRRARPQLRPRAFSFRIQLLGQNTRLARTLTTATALGDGTARRAARHGLAALSAFGSPHHHARWRWRSAATRRCGSARRLRGRLRTGRQSELVRQQIEGGLIHGIAAATATRAADRAGAASGTARSTTSTCRRARDSPSFTVELIASDAEPGGVTELAVPTAGPGHCQRCPCPHRRARSGACPSTLEAAVNPPPDHPTIPEPRVGVLLINLGTPDEASPPAVRRYLRQFLSDRRVVEISPLVWQPILRGVILRTRPKKSAHAYSQVWTEGGSPLAAITAAQAAALKGQFGPFVAVDYAMRYGNPAIGERIRALKEAGCTRILLAPLYPQYCAATTATANDEAFRTLAAMRWQPAVRTLPPYHDDPRYIAALATSIASQLAEAQVEPDAIMASFHGMPERTLHLGDPYHCHCQKTGRLLARR
jgi:isoquinoline 1-oxidoreductase beta subunit